jgi:UDP-N-acetylmuramate dehydrogenase
LYATPKSVEQLQSLIAWANKKKIPITFLGGGTNVLVSDEGVEGLVISTLKLINHHIRGTLFVCGSGLLLDTAINISIENFLSGLEPLGGLPGSVGGAVWGNSAAQGIYISNFIEWVDYVDYNGSLRRYHIISGGFAYKQSPFMEDLGVIVEVAFRLKPNKDSSQARLNKETSRKIRLEKGQFDYPSAGCFFKNQPNFIVGKEVDKANLKGLTVGGASISPSHANFIVNKNKEATSSQIDQLATLIEKKIYELHKVKLTREVQLIGRWTK